MTEHDKFTIVQPGPLLVDVPGACALLGVGRTSIYALLSDGRLRSVRLGRRRLIRVSDLEAFTASLEHVPASGGEGPDVP